MSDWLELELTRGLAPVAAPHILGVRLGFAPAKRWALPRVVLAVAAAVVLVIGAGYAASRTSALDLRQLASARPGEPATTCQVNAGQVTVLVAHVASASKTHDRALVAAPDAGCRACHTL